MKIFLLTIIGTVMLSGCYFDKDEVHKRDMKDIEFKTEYNLKKKEMCEKLEFETIINMYGYVNCVNK